MSLNLRPEAYAHELSFLHSELGYALFEPETSGQQPVAVGDIGFIHDHGYFVRFFNAFSQATDVINQTDTRTPPEFEPVPQVNQRISRGAPYSPGVFGSKGVKRTDINIAAEL